MVYLCELSYIEMNLNFLPQINWVDIIVAIFLIRGGYVGLNQGFSIELFKVLGTVAACVVSLSYYVKAAGWLASHSFLSPQAVNPISFVVLFFSVLIAFRILIIFLFRILHLGLFGALEKWGGLALGLTRSLIFASLFLFVLTLLPVEYFKESVEEKSFSGAYLKEIAPGVLDFVIQFKPKAKEN